MILLLFCFRIATILYRNCAEKRIAKGVLYTSLEFSLFSVLSMKSKPLPKYNKFVFGLFNVRCRFSMIFSKISLLLFDLKSVLKTALE